MWARVAHDLLHSQSAIGWNALVLVAVVVVVAGNVANGGGRVLWVVGMNDGWCGQTLRGIACKGGATVSKKSGAMRGEVVQGKAVTKTHKHKS